MNVLKNPVLDDSVLLEASAIGQFLHTDYIRSQSTPSIANLTEEELEAVNGAGGNFGPIHQDYQFQATGNGGPHNHRHHTRRSSDGRIHAYRVQVSGPNEPQTTSNPYDPNTGENMIDNWVARLPEYGRRKRSHTDPMRSLMVASPTSPSRAKTLPKNMSPVQSHEDEDTGAVSDEVGAEDRSVSVVEAISPVHVSPAPLNASKRTSVRSSLSSPSGGSETRHSSSLQSPVPPVTPNSKLVKIFMSRVQKGAEFNNFILCL